MWKETLHVSDSSSVHHHCCVCSKKLLEMDRETVRNIWIFNPKIKFEKLVYLVDFIIRKKSIDKFLYPRVLLQDRSGRKKINFSIKLKKGFLFTHTHFFSEKRCLFFARNEDIQIRTCILWKPKFH